MKTEIFDRNQYIKRWKSDPLYSLFGAAFCYAFSLGMVLTALPFVIRLLGGNEKDLGNAFGYANMTYLVLCLFLGWFLDHLRPKLLLLIGGMTSLAGSVGIGWLCYDRGIGTWSPISLGIFFMLLVGGSQTFFWPSLMGWVSAGYEGEALSKRLNTYNLMWSSALIISPFAAGYLLEWSKVATLWIVNGMMLMVLFFVVQLPYRAKTYTPQEEDTGEAAEEKRRRPVRKARMGFLWMARAGLIVGCISVGLLRTQLALLLTEHLGYSEKYFGYCITMMAVATLAVFFIAGRSERWHYHYGYFFAAQGALLAGLVLIATAKVFVLFPIACMLVGAGQSFLYSSHQYYGVSGGTKRAGLMAIHEILISIGFLVGPIIGGYLAYHQGVLWPYYFGAGIVGAALLGDVLIMRGRFKGDKGGDGD